MPGTRRSGRRPKPTTLHRLHGTRPRRARPHEPPTPPGAPSCPPAIARDATLKRIWDDFVEALGASRVLTPDCATMLACLTTAQADFWRFQQRWQKSGQEPVVRYEFVDGEGQVRSRTVANPLVRILRDQTRLVTQLATEFGLSPASRTKIRTTDVDAESELDAHLQTRPAILPFASRK